MNDFLNYALIIIIYIFDVYVIYRFMDTFFSQCNYDKKKLITCYVVKFVIAAIVAVYAPYPLVNMFTTLFALFLITTAYHSKISKKITTVLIIYGCIFLSEAIVAVGIGLSDFSVKNKSDSFNSFAVVMSEIVLWLFAMVIRKFKSINGDVAIPKILNISILGVIVANIILEILIFQSIHVSDIIVVISIILMLIINFLLIYLYDSLANVFREKIQSGFIMAEREYYKRQTTFIQDKYDELRIFKHDVKNKLYTIDEMIKHENIKQAEEYIEKLTNKIQNMKLYSQTNNIAIDSILNYKLSQADSLGVDIKVDINVPSDLNIDDDDIIIILGNLLDNAIEASSKWKDRYIKFRMQYDKGCLFIYVNNGFDGNLIIQNGKIKTNKGNDIIHGIGMLSVDDVILKYSGEVKYEYKKNEFIVNAIMYI